MEDLQLVCGHERRLSFIALKMALNTSTLVVSGRLMYILCEKRSVPPREPVELALPVPAPIEPALPSEPLLDGTPVSSKLAKGLRASNVLAIDANVCEELSRPVTSVISPFKPA